MLNNHQHHFNVLLAQQYGIEIAIFLDNIAFWIRSNIANRRNYHEGRYWTFNTHKAFSELFPYFTERQIKYVISKAIENDLIVQGNFNKSKFDKTNWYALTNKMLEFFGIEIKTDLIKDDTGEPPQPAPAQSRQNCLIGETELSQEQTKLSPVITDIKLQIKNTNTTTSEPPVDNFKIASSRSINFEQCKKEEVSNLTSTVKEHDQQEITKKFREESLTDEKCNQVYNERFVGCDLTIEEVYEECVDYFSQTGQKVYKARFLSHLKNYPVEKHHVKYNVANKPFSNPVLEERRREEKRISDSKREERRKNGSVQVGQLLKSLQ